MIPEIREPTDAPRKCLCDYAHKGLGTLYGRSMGKGRVRLTTHPKCPEHALCQGYTAKVRAKERNGEMLYCNVHGRKNCPLKVAP